MTDLATYPWDRSTWIVLRDGVRRDSVTGRLTVTKGTKMTHPHFAPGWLAADIERVKKSLAFQRWCESLADEEITAVVRYVEERRAAMANKI